MKRRVIAVGVTAVVVLGLLAANRRHRTSPEQHATWPEVSSTGERILFQRNTPRSSGLPVPEIYVAAADGSGEHRIAVGEQAMWIGDQRVLFLTSHTRGANPVTTMSSACLAAWDEREPEPELGAVS